MRVFLAVALGALTVGCGSYNRPMDGAAPPAPIAAAAPAVVDDKPQCDALRAAIQAGAPRKDTNDRIQAMQRLNCPDIPK